MLKKTITYTDFNGDERTEDYYFNLTKAELMEMELGVIGGMQAKMERIIKEHNTPELLDTFRGLILKSYGVKSPDGKRFMKSKEIVDDFVSTEAYSVLFVELATDEDAAQKFISAIMPADVQEAMAKEAASTDASTVK